MYDSGQEQTLRIESIFGKLEKYDKKKIYETQNYANNSGLSVALGTHPWLLKLHCARHHLVRQVEDRARLGGGDLLEDGA